MRKINNRSYNLNSGRENNRMETSENKSPSAFALKTQKSNEHK